MKTRQLLLTLLLAFMPFVAWADGEWQDPETKVNYSYSSRYGNAWVKAGRFSSAGSPNASGDISIREKIDVDGKSYRVTFIDSYAFSRCNNLLSVTIPSSISMICPGAFNECTGLTHVNLPQNLTEIDQIFKYCSSLTNVTIPESVTTIEQQAFLNCSSLTNLTIPSNVSSIGREAFSGCSGLNSISVAEENQYYDSRNNCNAIIETSSNTLILGCNNSVIPYGVESIENYSFKGCKNIVSLTIPASVKGIYSGVFQNCSGLKNIVLPKTIETLGEYVFSGCSSLTDIDIPNVSIIRSSSFYGCSSLTHVTIPETVTDIQERAFNNCSSLEAISLPINLEYLSVNAFRGCSSLKEIIIPKNVRQIGDYVFGNCDELTSISVDEDNKIFDSRNGCNAIIKKADNSLITGCNGTVIPNDIESIHPGAFYGCKGLSKVNIPMHVTNIGENAFRDCSNLSTVYSFIEYPFGIDNTVFMGIMDEAVLYVPAGSVELYKVTKGWYLFKNIIGIGDQSLTFTMIVTDEKGFDITDKVSIRWYDIDGKEIGTGKSVNGIANGVELYYSVEFSEELGRVYREVNMKKVVVENESITCQLEKIGHVQLEGRVSATDIDKTTMTVGVKQMLNGKWEQTYTTQTNEQGVFKVEVYDDVTDITISGDGYLDATLHRDGFGGNGNVGVIPMSLISGFAIAANINMQKAVAEGEAEEITTWADGLNNIDFTLTNATMGAAITDFTVQSGNVIIKTGAGLGDNISLTAKSKQSVFADATTEFTITEGANAFDLQLTELGGFDATCAVSNNGSTSGYLYNSNDVLVAKGSYVGETLSLRHLNSGVYTLVSMGNSSLLGSMTRLSDLAAVGLNAGTDYISTRVEVVDGELTTVDVSEVPQLDERQFYYTNNNTYFNANKAFVTAGNYLILQGHLDFKQKYADKADDVALTIELPEGCEMVENSAIANHQAVAYAINGNRVTMLLSKDQWQSEIRFCVIPTLNKSYTITAMVQFDIDGQITQPIGTAQFEAKGLSLSVPKLTSNTNITINGTAKGHSDISIYDYDVLIGKTSSKADGSWTTQCELYKPYNHSFHDICAKIATETGLELTSKTRYVKYEKIPVPEKVTMLYYNPEYDVQYNIVFDLINGTTSPSSYYFFPYKYWPDVTDETEPKDFTFLADFTLNDIKVIKNVNIKVLNSDGTVRTLPATFDGKRNCWVATTKYSSPNKLPVNVTVEYDAISNTELYDEEMEEALTTLINNMLAEVDNAYKDCALEMKDEDENSITFVAKTNGYETNELFKLTLLDYEQIKAKYAADNICHIQNDFTDVNFVVSISEENKSTIIVWDNLSKTAIKISEVTVTNPSISSRRRVIPFIMNAIYGVGISVAEYNLRMSEIVAWRKTLESEQESRSKNYNQMVELLYAKCPDGSYKIKDVGVFNNLILQTDQFSRETQEYLYKFQNVIDQQQLRLKQLCSLKGTARVIMSAGGAIIGGVFKTIAGASSAIGGFMNGTGGTLLQSLGNAMTNLGVSALTTLAGQAASDALDYKITTQLDQLRISPEEVITQWYSSSSRQLTNEYRNITQSITGSYSKCKEKEDEKEDEEQEEEQEEGYNDKEYNDEDNDEFKGKGSTPMVDPSGYVYEAVMSNRLEGVTATCYQKVYGEDMYGDPTEEAVVWNAEDYSQVNPQLTDKTGFYRWDVPQGMWQVKYEKDGYETVYSEWLPVPPPQLDVNIGMKQSTPPTVKQMRGTESGITITMGKYMRPQTMGEGNVTVTRNGMNEKGHLEMLDMEQEPKGSETFVSKVKFVPEFRFKTSDEVYVTVSKDVESYCGVKMGQDHREKVVIESEITDIVADSAMSVAYQGTKDVQVLVLPKEASAGRTLTAQSSSPMIASLSQEQVVIGENGLATLTLNGELPGGVVLTLSVDGTDVEKTAKVSVVIGRELVSTPVASIRNGERVELGTKLALTCDTEGATIYYTLDGSCPCNTATRQKYTEPFTLPNGVVTVKAMAENEDGEESDVVTFIYTVGEDETITCIKTLRDYVITYADGAICINGAQGTTCRVYDLQGRELAYRQLLGDKATLRVAKAESYIVSVTNKDGQTVVRKVSR